MALQHLLLSVVVLPVSPPPPPPQLQHEKAELEQHLEQEQEFQVNKLMKKIKKMENETIAKQLTLEQVLTRTDHSASGLSPSRSGVSSESVCSGTSVFSLPYSSLSSSFWVVEEPS